MGFLFFVMAAEYALFIYVFFDGKSSNFHALLLQTVFMGFFWYMYMTMCEV